MTRDQYREITAWQRDVFRKATPLSCVHHLEEEVSELKEKIEQGAVDRSEIADCFLLLIGVCNMADLTYDDILYAIDEKMTVNYQRVWGEPNEKGYVKHK
jgi:NTP pyrophosphatase (non-canonical NTP hydrolase)